MKKSAQKTINGTKYKVKATTFNKALVGWYFYIDKEKISFNNGVGLKGIKRNSADDMLLFFIKLAKFYEL